MALAPPDLPTLTILGSAEKIVDPEAVKAYMARWPGAEFDLLDGAEHEVLMEAPVYRDRVMARIAEWFAPR